MRQIMAALLLSGAATAAHAQTAPVFDSFLGIPFPNVNENGGGDPPDNGFIHVDGNWNSPYCATGVSGQILQGDTTWQTVLGRGTLVMTVPANTCNAAELASDRGWTFNGGQTFPYGEAGYGYGYYQVRMMTGYGPANASNGNIGGNGTVESFFVKGLNHGNLGSPEIDFEFLTNGTWDTPSSKTGVVWVTLSGSVHTIGSTPITLPFNPSAGFHDYGIDFQPGVATFYVDRKLVSTARTPDATLPADGLLIMANDWTGNPNWGGSPPSVNVSAYYRRIEFYAGATTPPSVARQPTAQQGLGDLLHGLQ